MSVWSKNALFMVVFALTGCGAKTGLLIPDASVDAFVPPDAPPCINVPWMPSMQAPVVVSVATKVHLERADVLFLVDITGSMGGEIDQIRARLRDTIAPAIDNTIPDSALGLATFADFPTLGYGDPGDVPYSLVTPTTTDLTRVQTAVNSISLESGGDNPEGQVEALYQSATGEGLAPWIQPSFGCPMGGSGYACFRSGSMPIIFLFTDAPFHNGPFSTDDFYTGIVPPPHSYPEAVAAVNSIGARVIGFASGEADARMELERVALDTHATNTSGAPLVFDIGADGQNLDTQVVSALEQFSAALHFNINAVATDPNPTDGVDVTQLVQAVVPDHATPMSGVGSVDLATGTFVEVLAGTSVYFKIILRNDVIAPTNVPQTFNIVIEFRGDGTTALGQATIQVTIPAINMMGCGDGGVLDDASITVFAP